MSASAGAPVSPPASNRMLRVRIGVLAAAVVVGLVLNHVLRFQLEALQMLAHTDPIAARARLAMEIRGGGLIIFAITGALGASVIATSRRAARDLQFPPPGFWGWGATRIVTGPPARWAAGVGLVLGMLLIASSLAGAALSWEMGTRLLQCRAGVPPSQEPGHPLTGI